MFTFTALSNAHQPEHAGDKESSAARGALKPSAPYLALLILSILLVPADAWAQVPYGSLVGNVTDPNGAGVSGAKVESLTLPREKCQPS